MLSWCQPQIAFISICYPIVRLQNNNFIFLLVSQAINELECSHRFLLKMVGDQAILVWIFSSQTKFGERGEGLQGIFISL